VAGGAANQLVVQSGSSASTFVSAPSTANTYLNWSGSALGWATAVGSTTLAAVGTYAFCTSVTGTDLAAGSTVAASDLRYADAYGTTSGTPSAGTWRTMGYSPGSGPGSNATVFVRIS
jgi:hypothetical protein